MAWGSAQYPCGATAYRTASVIDQHTANESTRAGTVGTSEHSRVRITVARRRLRKRRRNPYLLSLDPVYAEVVMSTAMNTSYFKLLTRDEFREGVFKRDNYKCVVCGAPAKDAHHIII